jgi:probable F420-dependent oxidoreductase
MDVGLGLITCQRPAEDRRPMTELYREAVELAVLAETVGFRSVWTSEHHFVDDGYLPSQLPVLAAIAARTSRIGLGTGVVLAPLVDPLHLAEDAAVVDLLSGGRLILGLGLGWREEEFDGFGIPRRERASRLEGTITVLRQAWSSGLLRGDGRHFVYPDLAVTPKPARPGGPPIWLGGHREAAVRRAARLAEGYVAWEAGPEELRQRVRWIEYEAAAVGRDPATIAIGVSRIVFAWPQGDPWERIRPFVHYISWKYGEMAGARSRSQPAPTPPLDPASEARLRSTAIVGHPDEVAEALAAYEPILGPRGLFVLRSLFPGLDPGLQREALHVLAEEVLPLLPRPARVG